MKRRQFIQSAAMLTGGVLASGYAFGRYAAPPALRVRREANSQAAQTDLTLYKKAVTVMKARPASDPTSWEAQAHIHNDWCPHGNWFFLPWHRAYLRQFELICREACGDSSFNLPYWDWTLHPSLPASFWGDGNPLMDKTRAIGPADKVSAELTGTAAMAYIMSMDSFEDFGSYRSAVQRPPRRRPGSLESTPHNNVHNVIRGNMSSLLSPRDPIFWLHHANVDRIWATWNDNGYGNPAEPDYADYIFEKNFYRTNGQAIPAIKAGEMSDQRALGYIYDTQTVPLAIAHKAITNFKLLAASKVSSLAAGIELKSRVPKSFTLKGMNKVATFAAPATPHGKREIKAIISDIVPPEKEDFFVRVFLNCPDLTKDTPITDPHYVTSFAFFGSHHDMPAGSHMDMAAATLSYAFDITDNLKRLKGVNKAATDEVKVQLLAVPYKKEGEAKLLAGKIDIIVAERQTK